MRCRHLSSRLKRAMGTMSVAELSRRSNVGRGVIARILRARGWVEANQQDVANIATALGVTFEYLAERGRGTLFVQAPPESELVRRGSTLLLENEVIRQRRDTLLRWLGEQKMELRWRNEMWQVVADDEVVAESKDVRRAVRLARGATGDFDVGI
jgi:transcriptional regulator with XRE-family HTH domain